MPTCLQCPLLRPLLITWLFLLTASAPYAFAAATRRPQRPAAARPTGVVAVVRRLPLAARPWRANLRPGAQQDVERREGRPLMRKVILEGTPRMPGFKYCFNPPRSTRSSRS